MPLSSLRPGGSDSLMRGAAVLLMLLPLASALTATTTKTAAQPLPTDAAPSAPTYSMPTYSMEAASPSPASPPPPSTNPLGYLEVLIASVFFGSNFVPVKRYETYDGMYYQWVMCSAIFMTGLFIQFMIFAWPGLVGDDGHATTDEQRMVSGRPDAYSVKFIPMASLGGALWATGNTLSVPVINMIGLSLGLLIWGSANMIMGWATGRFGLVPYTDADALENPALNTIGLCLAVAALGMYTQIKQAEKKEVVNSDSGNEVHSQLDDVLLEDHSGPSKAKTSNRIVGMVLAVVAGVLFGNTFSPVTYVEKGKDGPYGVGHGPTQDLNYVFSHFTGIFATSTIWFVVYCAIMKGSPMINNRLTLPAMLSGIMWAIAQTMWFLANSALSVSVSFPLITSGPGIISAMWGVFVFGEIQGTRNYVVLCCAILTAVTGCILIGVSKGD